MTHQKVIFLLTLSCSRMVAQNFGCFQQGDVYVVTCSPTDIRGGGADETAKLQGLLNRVPDYSTIYIPRGMKIYVTGLNLANRKGLKFTSGGAIAGGASSLNSSNAALVYHASGQLGGAVFSCDGCRDFLFENFVVDGGARADYGFKFFKSSTSGGEINSNVTFSRMAILNNSYGAGRPGWISIDWCGTGVTSNCEFLQVIDGTAIYGQGGLASVGVRIGHSNSVLNVIDGVFISGHHVGVSMIHGGTAKITRNLMDRNDIDIAAQGSESIEVGFSGQFFNGSMPVYMHDNRFGGRRSNAVPWIYITDVSSAATMTFINNVFSDDGSVVFRGGPPALISMGNYYPSADFSAGRVKSMGTFNKGFTSIGDMAYGYAGDVNSSYASVLAMPQPSNPGCSRPSDLGKQWFDSSTPAATLFKVCLNVAGVPTWVTK